MKKVYVILSRTGTTPSRFIRFLTGAEFTHASLAMLPCRHKLYSFARRNMHNFFIGGFVHEDVDKFIFAKHPNAICSVYEISVSDAAYEKMSKKLSAFEKNYLRHKYNFAGALTSQMGIHRELKYRYTCSQFVADILSSSKEITLPKHPSLIKPVDLAKIPEAKLIYSGAIKSILFKSKKQIHT